MNKKKQKKTAPLPPGLVRYTGPAKGVKSRLREPANLASGGCRTAHGVPATHGRA